MADNTRDEYLMILNIEKIVRTTTRSYNTSNSAEQFHSSQKEIIKLVIRDMDLTRLLNRGVKHLELVQDEEVDTDKPIGKPRG